MALNLSPTGWTILGFLSLQERSGYEIREVAKRTVGLVWGISDGQLYPQLQELHRSGLIEPVGAPEGPRSRQVWRLTGDGSAALDGWLRAPSAPLQMRDENLVKILFADQLGTDALLDLLDERRRKYSAVREELRTIVPRTRRDNHGHDQPLFGPGLVHLYGLSFVDAVIGWCDRAITSVRSNRTSLVRAGSHQAAARH